MRHHLRDRVFSDTTGKRCTGFQALVGARLIGLWLSEQGLGDKIPLLLPASVGGALVNIATVMQGKVAVNLNFSLGEEALANALTAIAATKVITSRAFLEKAGIPPHDQMIFLEDMQATLPIVFAETIMGAGTKRGYRRFAVFQWQHRHPENHRSVPPKHHCQH
jgi:acyl-[acyl-carrier-protein]-phospholipid O-acyltransferase/long-chain-fatty-acid--[acyl-carrier-protein] ligase